MAQFFRKTIDQKLFTGSRETLDAERLRFRQNQISGAFEIEATSDELQVLVMGDGEEIGAYCLYPNSRMKIKPNEIGLGWKKPDVPIRSVALPDQASRALWQAMEFQVTSHEEAIGLAGWKAFLDRSYKQRLTGMVGIASELGDGFVFLQEGMPSASETVFCSAEGFTNSLQGMDPYLDTSNLLTLYKADPATQAYQCALLRQGMAGWGRRILANYKDMVGQKLLQILNSSLNAMLMHQQINIYLTDIDIVDLHFFCECRAAAAAYQNLLVSMSQLIGRVIGGMVTRRIMTNTFERLALAEQEVITSNTLAPAAFLR